MELLRNYTAVIESVVTNGVAFVETDLHPRKAEDIIALHKHLAEMDLRFATGIRKAELEWDIGTLNSTKRLYWDAFEVYRAYSGSTLTFIGISTAEGVAWMLSEVDRREKVEREADIRTVIIESKPQPDRFINKVLNFISGGYYY